MLLVCIIDFQSHPCQTDKRASVKNQNNVFLHLLDYSSITGPTRGFKILIPITSITMEARFPVTVTGHSHALKCCLNSVCRLTHTATLHCCCVYINASIPFGFPKTPYFSPIASAVNYVIKIREIK